MLRNRQCSEIAIARLGVHITCLIRLNLSHNAKFLKYVAAFFYQEPPLEYRWSALVCGAHMIECPGGSRVPASWRPLFAADVSFFTTTTSTVNHSAT